MPASETMLLDTTPLWETSPIRKVNLFQRQKTAGPNGTSPSLFSGGGRILTPKLSKLLDPTRAKENNPKDWCESLVAPTYKEDFRSSCEHCRGIILLNFTSKLLPDIILLWSSACERCVLESQVGFRSIRGCIHQIFRSRQILGHKPIIFAFPLSRSYNSVAPPPI